MAGTEISKAPSSSAMDIVSMAFSNVSENSNLMEVVSVVSQGQASDGQEVTSDSTQHVVHCATESMEVDAQTQSADIPNQNDHEQSGQIEIPLPPNAIITVNEQGEQIIELSEVVEGSDQTCLIEHAENVNCVEQIEQVEQVETMSGETAPEPASDITMSVGEDGLEAMTFHEGTVGMQVGNDACVPVTISLTDVQNLQQTVDGTSMVGPSGDNVQVSSADGVTSGTSQLVPASENALFGSLANIINTSSVSSTSNSVLPPAAGMEGVTFVSATGVPIQSVSNVRNAAETQTMIDAGPTGMTGSPAPAAQFIHNGRNLQQINLNENLLISTKSQFVNNTQTTTMGVGPVINSSQVPSLAPAPKIDSSTSSIVGNRSVFSPMTLTIRTPPGAPAVNQALINSIVNNTEVQALLKRNPGQPITIVRVPEDPLERRNNAGVVSAKIVTNSNSASSASTIPRRVGVGRPRKVHTTPLSHTAVRKRGRQPGTKLVRRKEEEYVSPVSWQPVKSRTRSGRISRPPGYRTENFKSLSITERSDNHTSDVEESSDVELDASSRVSVTLSGRIKRFKCRRCSKAYIGRGGLARHLGAEPTHGSIDSYDTMEETSPKPVVSTTQEVQSKPDHGLSESEGNDKDATQEGAKTSNILSKSDGELSHLVTEEDEPVVNQDNEADKPRDDNPGKESQLESTPSGRRGRPPAVRHSNSSKEDPDFKPGISSNKANASVKSKERRKETMRQALKFLNNEDYMDVCLPRVVRNLSLWEFLISKSELDKEDTSQVLKVLQLFEELLSEVREMAVNCLEKVDDEDKQTEGIYLDEDEDLARVLEFDKGWYNVSEPPAGAVGLPFSVTSLMKRAVDVMDTDEQIDEEISPMKRRKVEDGQQGQVGCQKSPPKLSNSKMKPMPKLGALTDPKSITVHVHDGRVTTEPGSPHTTIIRAPLQESKSSAKMDQEQLDAPNSRIEQQKGLDHVTSEKPSPTQQTSKPTHLTSEQNSITSLDPGHQPGATSLTPLDTESQPPSVEESSRKQQPPASTEPSTLLQPQPPTDEPSQQDIQDGQQSAWSNEDTQGPSGIETQFGRASQELASLAASASSESNQNDKVDQVEPSDHIHQEETSVVVPEGSTIMQMQDGTFLVQRPDGTAMQIHTPEGMTIETVQELLSMEAGQG